MVLISDPSGQQRLVATNQPDSILLSAGQLTNYPLGVALLEGNDTLQGSNGSEEVNGNSGGDMLIGFGGNDLLLGGQGDDYLVGNDGNDTLVGNKGKDLISGGTGNDILLGGNGGTIDIIRDQITTVQYLTGGDGNDTLIAGIGVSGLIGGVGEDLFILQPDLVLGIDRETTAFLLGINRFEPKIDKIGLTGGYTKDDIILEESIYIPDEEFPNPRLVIPENLKPFFPEQQASDLIAVTNPEAEGISTTIYLKTNEGNILIGSVSDVTPAQIRDSFITVTEGFVF